MIRSLLPLALLVAGASPSLAQGPIDTIARGAYVCELPEDVTVGRGRTQADQGFTIDTGSRYSSAKGNGTYLRRGDLVVMTSGPHRGEKYTVVHPGFLRLLGPDNRVTRMRCVLSGNQR
jgi:hypothetical protein